MRLPGLRRWLLTRAGPAGRLGRVWLGLGTAAVLFGALELGLRAVVHVPPPPPGIAMKEDPEILWTLGSSGDHARPNSLGLRGAELPPRSTVAGRLLTLGDSSVYGDTVTDEQVFSAVLAARLSGAARIDAANGGVPGYSTVQARVLYARVREAVQADVVVVGTLWSDAAPGEETDVEHLARVRAELGFWGPVNRAFSWVQARSALFRAVRDLRHGNLQLRAPTPPPRDKVGWVHADDALPPGAVARVPLADYRANLAALVAAVRDDGAEPCLLLLPHPYDERGQALPAHMASYRVAMREVAREQGVPLADGEAWFKAHPGGGRFADDIHPNAAGHAAVAELLVDTLRRAPALAARLGGAP